MSSYKFLKTVLLFSLLAFSGLAFADYKPDIRPGLWETRMSLKVDMLDALSAQLSTLPKEMQQQMREKMAGLSEGRGHVEKECITAEEVKTYFDDIEEDEDCKSKLLWSKNGQGSLTTTCAGGRTQRSEIFIHSPKEIKITSTFTEPDGTSGTSTWEGRWQSDNCGSVKPED